MQETPETNICLYANPRRPGSTLIIKTIGDQGYGEAYSPFFVNVAQLQKMLGISRHCAYSLIRDGYIPGILIGNSYKVPKKNIIDYVFGSTVDGKQEVPV